VALTCNNSIRGFKLLPNKGLAASREDDTMTKHNKPEPTVKPVTTPPPSPERQANTAPIPMADLIELLRAASSIDDAVRILTPGAKPKAKADTSYEVNPACVEPLPQKRGLSVLLFATAARMNQSFTLGDMEAALPGRKSVRYWLQKLVATQHLIEVAAK
jgi:hypothetical protein